MIDPQLMLLIVVVTVIVTAFGVAFLRYGGFRGALFGARVLRELGEVTGEGRMFGRHRIARVYELEGDGGGKRVGLEVFRYGKRVHLALDSADAQRLARLLDSAAR
jgi:hypothetical protein